MKNVTLAAMFLCARSLAQGAACPIAPLTTYLNGGSYFSCTNNDGSQTIEFNHDILPSYVALNLLSANNSSANAASINVISEDFGLRFAISGFPENQGLLSSQAELIHFLIEGGSNPIVDTMLSVDSSVTSAGGLGLSTVLGIEQELVCVGGTFTSLPVGLVTGVANGWLEVGAFGCNGTAFIVTVADSSGPLSVITSALVLPNLSDVTNKMVIHLSPNATKVDVIKLQALLSVAGGRANNVGFGSTYILGTSSAPEPGSAMLFLGAGITVAFCKWRRRSAPSSAALGKLTHFP
jgi:hypothetical protein